ncbi:MAG: hypothetical protein IPN72_06845 [Saprospiraceae bacterium]|nr:hypothetical protein [Saprospiraceae bacterium]
MKKITLRANWKSVGIPCFSCKAFELINGQVRMNMGSQLEDIRNDSNYQ